MELKNRLCSAPVLTLPDLQQPFEIEIDASDYAIGVVLTQQGHLVAYHNETLSDTVRKYPTYEKEMYSIVICKSSRILTTRPRVKTLSLRSKWKRP